ncbi:MAG TPA: HEAT repeat domain-containing protein, partial [Chthoniobacteraceae bacterium]
MSETSEVLQLFGHPEMRRCGWGWRRFSRRALIRTCASMLILAVFSGAQLSAEDPSPETELPPPPQPWQIAGIRAAFGDARQPINEPSPAVQREALKLCAEKKWGDALDAQEVSAYLGSKDPAVRLAAVQILGQMGSGSGRFVKDIAALIEAESQGNNDSNDVRSAAEEALGRIGALDLVPLLESDCSAVRDAAANALGTNAKSDAEAAKKVAVLLTDKRPFVRAAAAFALSQMGKVAAESATEIAALLADG